MAREAAFQPMGLTYKANVTTSSQQVTITPSAPCSQLCVANHQPTDGTGQPVYFRISANISDTATVPTNGSPQSCLVSVPGTIKVFTMPGQASPTAPMYVTFIGEGGTPECYFTPGEGI